MALYADDLAVIQGMIDASIKANAANAEPDETPEDTKPEEIAEDEEIESGLGSDDIDAVINANFPDEDGSDEIE